MKHIKKRVAALLLTLAMVLSLAPMAFAADEFPDMPAEDDPSYAAVKSAIDNKIMTGENGELKLEGTILRSTVAKMVVTTFAAKGEADLSGYPDVDSEAWYAAWMAKANQMGIMTGTSGKMNPSNEVTLAEVAAMLCRALGLPTDEDAAIDGVAAWAAPFIKALIDAGYITAEDAAAAHEPMTRGNFAEVIYKVSGEGNYAKEENAEITEDVNSNIVITANGVSLKGITVKGDVIIADGVDAGSIVLDDVKVEGRIVVRGAGAELTNGTTASATVVAATTGETTVKADAGSDAGDIAVAGTHGKAADKVTLDMAEPKATVTIATEVAVQNAEGGEITLQAPNASLSVESGSVANVTVADGASGVKVDVAEGATIDKVTTNTDLAVTGEGTVSEKEGSGTVTDGSGSEVGGSDEPVDVPVVEEPKPPVEELPDELKPTAHTHNFITKTTNGVDAVVAPFDATRHTIKCVANGNDGHAEGYDAGCGAVSYAAHEYDSKTNVCICGFAQPGSVTDKGEDLTEPTTKPDNWKKCADDAHDWKPTAANVEGNVAATCVKEGAKVMECSICHCTRVDTTAPLGHNIVTTGTDAATCNAPGAQHFKCTRCDADIEDVVIPATGNHTWKLDSTAGGDDCKSEIVKHYVCTTCTVDEDAHLAAETRDINTGTYGPHTFDSYTVDGNVHTATCTTCPEPSEGNGNKPKATNVITGHNMVTVTEGENAAKAATCTVPGQTAGKKCSIKGCSEEIDPVEIPATGHTFDKNWTVANEGHWHKCTACTAFNTAEAAKNAKDKTGFVAHAQDATECKACGWTKTGGSGSGSGGSNQPAEHQHSKGSTIKYDETQHWYICDGTETTCEAQKFEPTNHNWGSNATSPNGKCTGCDATHTCDEGGTGGACSVCGYKASASAPNPGT